MKKPLVALLLAVTALVATPQPAQASHSLEVTTRLRAILLSPTQVEVRGTLTCAGAPEDGSIGVVLIQPLSEVAQDGGGSTPFSCQTGETLRWSVLVTANSGSAFRTGPARFSTYANTPCSDAETDCPSASSDGTLTIGAASRSDGLSIDPRRFRFGAQPFGSFTKRTVTITNLGSRTLDVSIDSLFMPDDFSPGQPESTCPLGSTGAVNILLPGESCTHTVGFQPDPFFAQPERAALIVTASDLSGALVDSTRVLLTGRGY